MVSTNRGLWLSVGIAVVYYALRRAFAGDVRPMLVTVFVTALLVTITLLTPLQQSIANRFSGAEASNTTRERLYDTALAESLRSPLLGYGAPQSTDEGPAIGTHGLMWYVMFSHGFPALALLFLSAAALIVATARVRTPMGVAAHLSIVIFATQIPFYGLFPQIVLVGVAAGIALRETSTHDLELAA
jgi:O-antigen ligase